MVNSEHCDMYLKNIQRISAQKTTKRPRENKAYDMTYQFLVVNWLTRKATTAKQLALHEFLMAETSSSQVTDRNITKAAFAPGVVFIPPRVTLYYAQIQ